jgi:hypothetical protein
MKRTKAYEEECRLKDRSTPTLIISASIIALVRI